ncbi:unnamed protein product, partial [Brassica oleracea var. botrytis]
RHWLPPLRILSSLEIPLPALPYGARNLFPTGLAPWNHASSVSSSIDFLLLIRCTMYRIQVKFGDIGSQINFLKSFRISQLGILQLGMAIKDLDRGPDP